MIAEMGSRNGAVDEDENEPGHLSTMPEWDGHDQMHAASEMHGDDFSREAGTEGLEWATHIWHAEGTS